MININAVGVYYDHSMHLKISFVKHTRFPLRVTLYNRSLVCGKKSQVKKSLAIKNLDQNWGVRLRERLKNLKAPNKCFQNSSTLFYK